MRIFLQERTITTAILQKTYLNWGILGSLILAFMLSSTTSFGTCYNVTSGGTIGSDQSICSGSSVTITNDASPTGGSGALEYMWLANVSGPDVSGASTFQSSNASITTPSLTETVWYRRCSRRAGCSSWNYGESNWIKITVNNAEFEHVDFVDESSCNANDGKIITDPYINGGTTLPYTVTYTYDGQNYSAGPYSQNQDNYITGLAPGIYSNILMTDANGCTDTYSDITIAEYTCTTNPNCTPVDLVKYNMDACESYSSNNTNYIYDEFTPEYPNASSFLNVSASQVTRDAGPHSCIAGQGNSGKAACFGVGGLDEFQDDSDLAIRFSVTLDPNETGKLTQLQFHEMAPALYAHISGNSGTNDYPTKWGIRVLKNGAVVYKQTDIATFTPTNTAYNNNTGWNLATVDFSNDPDFMITTTSTFEFELLSYDNVGNGGSISAWDLDNIIIKGVDCNQGSTVGDFVFNDKNGNGIQEAGEDGLPGVSVMLINTADNSSASATTDQDGKYLFSNVDPGNYKVKFPTTGTAASLTYNLTIANQGTNDNVDSDPVPMGNGSSDAMTAAFDVTAGDNITNIDAGYYIGSKLTGVAFQDADVDGVRAVNDNRLEGITVMLLDGDGNMVASTTTNEFGVYTFDNLAPGNYKVKVGENATDVNDDSFVLTFANEGTDDTVDSDAVRMNDGSGNAMTQLVYVENGATIENLDAGYVATARLGDFVFEDKNKNGVQDSEDAVVEGATVNLSGTDIFGNAVSGSTTTDEFGKYAFEDLAPGTYTLSFASNNPNFITTEKDAGSNGVDALDSDINDLGNTDDITLESGDNNETIDAGFIYGNKLRGIVSQDANVDGIRAANDNRLEDITVMLLDGDGNMVDQISTDENGAYEFDNLAPGNYKVKFGEAATDVNGDTFVLTFSNEGTDDTVDSDAVRMNNGSGNAMTQIVLLENNAIVENLDAGYVSTARLGDMVFEDVNNNGIQDNQDAPIENATVTLFGEDIFGNTIDPVSTTTNEFGKYAFEDLAPGEYYLTFESNNPTFIPTIKDFSGNGFDEDDSDISSLGRTDIITLNSEDNNITIDAGFKFDPSLPVELTNFEARLMNSNQVALTWSTASEENNKHFVIERSLDGNEFFAIGVIGGNGTTNLVNHYTYDDLDPFFGNNYYRLKQVDYDGNYEYSHIEIVAIGGEELPDLIMYPNPVRSGTTLRVVTPFENDTTIEIVNTTGTVMQNVILERGRNSKHIDLSGYPAGMYFAYINYNGHRTLVYNIVKVDE